MYFEKKLILIAPIPAKFMLKILSFELILYFREGPSWSCSYGSRIYNYLCKSVPITTDVVSLNLDQGEVYNII